MKNLLYAGIICCLALTLAACGPKDISEGTTIADYGTNPASEPEAHLRYPVDGNRLQQRLFLLNQPQVMESMQQRQRDYFHRRAGVKPSFGEPLVPKQPSPFRQ